MGCYCKILVALDGSPDAYAALHHALAGLVSATVLRESTRPVLLVRAGDAPSPPPVRPASADLV